jgi:hypothetical protein
MIEHLKNNSVAILLGIIISLLIIYRYEPNNAGATALVIIISFSVSFTITRGVSYVFNKLFKKK